jgi:hypothetical protein
MLNSIQVSHPMIQYPMPEEFQSGAAAPDPLAGGDDSAGAIAPIGDFGANLSPDALMAYCQSRLDSIDDQASTLMKTQQANAATIQQIDTVISALKPYATEGVNSADDCANLESKFGTLITSLQKSDPGCPELPALNVAYNSMVWSGTGGQDPGGPGLIDEGSYASKAAGARGDNNFSSDEVQGYVQTLTDAAGNINSDSELQMVQLQSLMSQRQTAISLTTNLVQSLGDQENKIADNIGH